MLRKVLLILLLLAVLIVASAMGTLALVRRASAGRLYSSTSQIPHRRVGLVLGCKKKMGDGTPNPFFDNRLRAATELFKAGKIDYFLVSGDNHVRGYDEATDMKDALLQAGVPPHRIYSDCAGFRTLDSIVRARDVFGIREMTVISQEFHNQRAIFLASHHGVDAIGYNAQDADLGDVLRHTPAGEDGGHESRPGCIPAADKTPFPWFQRRDRSGSADNMFGATVGPRI